jgi:hypothetical protein
MARFLARQLPDKGGALGQILSRARETRGVSLAEVSHKLKLPLKYLESLEKGTVDGLPVGDYGRYFLRRYAEWLNLDIAAVTRLYNDLRPSAAPALTVVSQKSSAATVNSLAAVRKPWLRRLVFILTALAVVVYLAAAAITSILPPKLSLLSPSDNLTTSSPILSVSGLTEVGVQLSINEVVVEVSNKGRFDSKLPLRPGLNIITVLAQKSYSRPRIITRQVLFTPSAEAGLDTGSVVP